MTLTAHGVETRTNILNCSLALFSESGYDATSVAEICQQAGVSKGAFYHHFPSKQDLFLALMTRWLEEVDQLFLEAGESAQDIPQALGNIAVIVSEFFDQLKGGFPILLEFWRQASRRPAIWQQAVSPYRRYLDYFAAMIQTGMDEGAFKEDIDPEQTARILMAIAMGLLLQASFDPDGADWKEITQSTIQGRLRNMRK